MNNQKLEFLTRIRKVTWKPGVGFATMLEFNEFMIKQGARNGTGISHEGDGVFIQTVKW